MRIIPTKTIPQGLSALMGYVPDLGLEENEKQMNEDMGHILSGEVTHAVRDSELDGAKIRKGDYMGLGDKGILAVNPSLKSTVFASVKKLLEKAGKDAELITVYYGEGVKEEEGEEIAELIRKEAPALEVQLFFGGQPVYPYIFSVE